MVGLFTLVSCLLSTSPLATSAEVPDSKQAESKQAPKRVLILTLTSPDFTGVETEALTAQLAELLGERPEYRVVTADEINSLVANQKQLSDIECQDDACIAELSNAAHAELVLSGSVGKVGASIILSLSLLDSNEKKSIGSAMGSASSLDDISKAIPQILAEVFLWGENAAQKKRYRLPEGREVSFAVFDFKALGIAPDIAQNLTQLLAVTIKKIRGTQVISRDDISAMLELESTKDAVGCTDDVSCLAEIGGALGVEKLVIGHVGKLGQRYLISLRIIDVSSVVVESRVSEDFSGVEEQLLPATRQAVRELFSITDEDPGGVSVTGTQQEAEVFLNDQSIGLLPIPPVSDLIVGRHNVRVSKDGYLDWRSDFYVEPGSTAALWIDMKEAPEKWYQKWWVWAGGGTLAAGIVGGGLYLALRNVPGTLEIQTETPGGL